LIFFYPVEAAARDLRVEMRRESDANYLQCPRRGTMFRCFDPNQWLRGSYMTREIAELRVAAIRCSVSLLRVSALWVSTSLLEAVDDRAIPCFT
jgi:hypothetical protein